MKYTKSFLIKQYDSANYITEAFGIDAGYKKEIYDIDLPDTLPQIVYITGESGCGKTTLIKELGMKIEDLIIPDKPLFEWHKDPIYALKLLSLVGLGDATLFISTYKELSDSQQARARIFLQLLSDNSYIYIDEFLSTLDRKTAKAVAYVIQKAIRKTKKILIVATAHNDLVNYLQPNLIIEGKAFPSRWEVITNEKAIINPYKSKVTFEYKDKTWYHNLRLGELHYKGKYTGGVKEHLGCFLDGKPIGVLVSIYRMHDGKRRIARVVIHPSYRGCGLGALLVSTYLKDYPETDVIAAMALYNPIFEKAGMIRVPDIKIKPPKGLLKELEILDFDKSLWHSKSYCDTVCLSPEVRKILATYSKHAGYLVTPAGEYLTSTKIEYKILNEINTASRVLWGFRPRLMAKYINKNEEVEDESLPKITE